MSPTTGPIQRGVVPYRLLRFITAAIGILGPGAMIGAAIVITLMEGDWWFNLFLAFLGAIALISFSLYVSVVTLLWELTRHVRRKAGMEMNDTPVSVVLHRILLPASVAGLVSAVTLPLILLDLINGMFAWIHFACGGALVITLAVSGIYSLIRRIKDHRRAEAERLAQEKQAWESYLS